MEGPLTPIPAGHAASHADTRARPARKGGEALGKRLLALVTALILWAGGIAAAEETGDALRRGDRGEAVQALQTMLQELGYDPGKIDGIYGARTAEAVRAFQGDHGLPADGEAGAETLSALRTALADPAQRSSNLARIKQITAANGVRRGTVLLTRGGETLLDYSFGGMTEETCLRVASVTKWVTAIGLMTLYDQGKLDLDEDIGRYLPFPVRNPAWPDVPITARMLLTHTSSLSPKATNYHPNWKRIGKNGYDPVFTEKIRPGSQYAYADYNGAMFGCLIEAITGESVQRYLDRTVFKPLGITASYDPGLLPAGTPTDSLLNPRGGVQISVSRDLSRGYRNRADPAGNCGYTVGRLYTNALGLTRLAEMMLGGGAWNGIRILSEETVRLMEADQPGLAKSPYGLSNVRETRFPGGTWYGHQGRYSGLSANVYYQRETGAVLVMILNGYDYQLEENVVLPAATMLREMESFLRQAEQADR